ncbi:hypothetical protein BCF11_4326 [Collimonas sp. PA-H2]|uniref:hypothetical protein n=1 Tax=Collimonas sp. PA-H2 TaxID=1881062 RepID=UPI000BF2C325|nr:hypothetical protein [Collimonas sp. PA-H2]PFH11860.1 hypothetical protein BCF11_4326 [Collimonas sp. PA-H2]
MTIKSFINAQQQRIAGTPSKGWTFGWTSAQAASHARHNSDAHSRQHRQPAQSYGMYGTLISGR